MIEIKPEDSKIVDIGELIEWGDNSRWYKDENIVKLKHQLSNLGQYKPILTVREDDKYVVIGGNARLRAMKELGVTKAWILNLDLGTGEEKIKVAISDNDNAGYYVPDKVIELMEPYKDDISIQDYNISIDPPDVYLDTLFDYEPELTDRSHVGFTPEVERTIDYILFIGKDGDIAKVKTKYGLSRQKRVFDIELLIRLIGEGK